MPTKILAIDDSKTMRLAIKITFAAEDADVTSVSKGSEAVARAKQMAADVVLVDARLADGEPSGYDVCQQLKSDPGTSGIPVILLVSGQTGVEAHKLKASGADGWIAKPFDTQELIDKVAEVVGGAVAQPAAASGARPAAAAARPAAAASRAPQTPAPRPTTRPPVAAAVPAPAAQAARPVAAAQSTSRTMPVGSTGRPVVAQSSSASSSGTRPMVKVAPAPARPLAPGDLSSRPSGADIPIAIPIPFTSADAPTPGILARLAEAGHTAGLDPRVAEALVAISREVIEAVVWEVVPDLAEQIIKQQSASR